MLTTGRKNFKSIQRNEVKIKKVSKTMSRIWGKDYGESQSFMNFEAVGTLNFLKKFQDEFSFSVALSRCTV